MPLPKRQTLPAKAKSSDSNGKASEDTRFANFQSDAKYRLPAKRHSKTPLDERFSGLLTDPDFYSKSTVDRYGRKKDKDAGKKALAKLYDIDGEEDESEEEADEALPEKARRRDKAVEKELKKIDIREGGISSSDESSSDEDDDDEPEEGAGAETELAESGGEVPMGEVTNRLAAVNLDWDHIRAQDIMAVANSFLPADGNIRNVIIYPSEFGMERLQREEIEGPPREIFASSSAQNKDNITSLDDTLDPEESEDEEQIKKQLLEESTGEEFDSKALRRYQLDRLRYYYAIIECSTKEAAKAIYDNMDGREYLSSANFFDLRFVPDGTTFDEEPHDKCERLADGYKPNEFSTDALTHSKVSLTWDADDTTRKEVQKRAFSRKEIDENELQAYIGSESEDEEETAKPDKVAALRAALGLGSSGTVSKSHSSKRDRDFKKPEGEMQVTFSAGLSTNAPKGSVFENEPILNETTIEKYVRKQRERKMKRKMARAQKEGGEAGSGAEEEVKQMMGADSDDEDPFNDPFFQNGNKESTKSQSKKSKKARKLEEEKLEKEKANERANLELLMVDDEDAQVRHFNMDEIIKAEKSKKKNKKKSKDEVKVVEDDFKINTEDPRFANLYESHEFAIDPTNPKFKPTAGMKALLEEGRKKRKHDRDDGTVEEQKKKRKSKEENAGELDDLKKLAARVKAKSKKV